MLLTVIAVATLLVAVVGATFAYFSLTVSGSASTTATVTTEKLPTVTISAPQEALYLKVAATDMIESNAPQYYYAKDATCEEPSCYVSGSASPIDSNYYQIMKVEVTDGPQEASYTCTGKIKVTSESLASLDGLASGDITVGFKNLDGQDGTQTVDSLVVKSGGAAATQDVNLKISGNSSATVSAYVLLTNTSVDQSKIAGQTLSFNIAADSVKCAVDEAGD